MPHVLAHAAVLPLDIAVKRLRAEFASAIGTGGLVGDGVTDDTLAWQNLINDMIAAGGGQIYVPGGYTYSIGDWYLPTGNEPLTIWGDGVGSLFKKRGTSTPSGKGWLDIRAGSNNKVLQDLCFDGNRTSAPTGIDNSTYAGDPLHPSLSDNTSIWIHDGANHGVLRNIKCIHSPGYSGIMEANGADITDWLIEDFFAENCYPAMFGYSGGPKIYGAWNAGFLLHGNGLSGSPYACRRIHFNRPKFNRVNGNCIWSHLYGFNTLHEQITIDDPQHTDIGRDGIEIGGISGYTINNPRMRRIGYTVADDTTPSSPAWIANQWAVGIDHAGENMGGQINGGELISCNGGYIDGDGMSNAIINGTICRTPRSTDPEYTQDGVGAIGWGGSSVAGRDFAYGFQSSNSSNTAYGGDSIKITAARFINLSGGSIKGYALRNSQITDCYLEVPTAPSIVPIILGNIGTASNQRSYNNVVTGCKGSYSPSSSSPLVFEDANGSAFQAGDTNWVFNNPIVSSSSNVFEFLPDVNTSSTTRTTHSSNTKSAVARSEHWTQREGLASASTSALKTYLQEGTSSWQHMQLQGYWKAGSRGPLLNVSEAGTGGVFATGARTTSVFTDAVLTGKGYFDSFAALTDTTYANVDADLLNAVVGGGATGVAVVALLRYKGSVGYIEQSITVTSSARDWIAFGSGSAFWAASGSDIVNTNTSGRVFITGTSSGNNYILKLNDASSSPGINLYSGATKNASWAAGATAAFTVRDSADTVRFVVLQTGNTLIARTTDDSSGGVLQLTGFISASVGLFSPGTAATTINIPKGGGTLLSVISSRGDGASGITIDRPSVDPVTALSVSNPNRWGFGVSSLGFLSLNDDTAVASRMTVDLSGLFTFGTSVVIDQSGNVSYSGTLAGNRSSGVAINIPTTTSAQAIQVPNGGVTAKYLVASPQVVFIEATLPSVSVSGQSIIAMDSATHTVKISQSTGAFVDILSAAFWASSGSDIVQTNNGAVIVYNSTPSTGISKLFVRAGAGQSTGNLQEWADNSATVLSAIKSDGSYYNLSSSATAVYAPSGGVNALSLTSLRNDGDSGLVLSRSSSTARDWGLNVGSSGQFILRDRTASATRMLVDTAGLFTIGSAVLIDQAGNVSISAVFTANGSGAGVNVQGVSSSVVNSIQTVGGIQTDVAYYMKTLASAPAVDGGYGGLSHKSGSVFRYSNGSTWTDIDFSSISSFWALSGSDIVNTNTSNRVFVSGTSSSNNYVLKIIDASSSPGVNLYSGSTKNASWAAGSTAALDVRDGSDTHRLIVLQAGQTLIARTSDIGDGSILQITGFMNASVGYYSGNNASTTVNIPSGGVTALSLISQRTDNASGVTIDHPGVRTFGLAGSTAVDSSGALHFNDSSTTRMFLDSAGRLIIGPTYIFDTLVSANRTDNLQIKTVTDASIVMQATNSNTYLGLLMMDDGGNYAASFQYGNTGLGGGFGAGNFFIAVRTTSGNITFHTTSSLTERLRIKSNGEVQVSSGQITMSAISGAINLTNGAFWYDSGSNLFQFRQNGATVGIGGAVSSVSGSGSGISVSPTTGAVIVSNTGVTSAVAGTGVSVSSGTGAVTFSIGQAVGTSNNVTFNTVTLGSTSLSSLSTSGGLSAAKVITCTASSGNQFQGNGGTFLVDATGNVSGGGTANFIGGYQVSGNTVINSSGVLSNAFGVDVNAGIAGTGFNIHGGGGTGQTITSGAFTSQTFVGGILTNYAVVSDSRLKVVSKPFTYGLAAILALSPVFYNWTDQALTLYGMQQEMRIGLLAQNVLAVMPDTVFTERNGYYGYDKDAVIAALVVSVQQLKSELDALRA